jgi:hypothetical protein
MRLAFLLPFAAAALLARSAAAQAPMRSRPGVKHGAAHQYPWRRDERSLRQSGQLFQRALFG